MMEFVAKTIRFPKDANDEASDWAKRIGISFNDYIILAVRHMNQAHRSTNKEVGKQPQKKSEFSLGFDFDMQDEILRSLVSNKHETLSEMIG